jgi:hypothetical protein
VVKQVTRSHKFFKEYMNIYQASVDTASVHSSQFTFNQTIERIFACRRITRADQKQFMTVLLSKNALSETETTQINRVFDALRSGLLKVVE